MCGGFVCLQQDYIKNSLEECSTGQRSTYELIFKDDDVSKNRKATEDNKQDRMSHHACCPPTGVCCHSCGKHQLVNIVDAEKQSGAAGQLDRVTDITGASP